MQTEHHTEGTEPGNDKEWAIQHARSTMAKVHLHATPPSSIMLAVQSVAHCPTHQIVIICGVLGFVRADDRWSYRGTIRGRCHL
jgi:hypothetical protein